MTTKILQLGLIGDNIAKSESPRLHRLAGQQFGIDVRYDLLVPWQINKTYDAIFNTCKTSGFRGLNITYPYKKLITDFVQINDPMVRAMGAVNTVLFENNQALGFNTDYSGFKAAYSRVRGAEKPGIVTMIGAGGVGLAVAFGLADLQADVIRLVDRDADAAEALAKAVMTANPDVAVEICDDTHAATKEADGLINCTPIGMDGYPGSVFDPDDMERATWAFDAVYTPRQTVFLNDAEAAGLKVISGWELFFYQGVDAWRLFHGTPADEHNLRASLLSQEE